MCGYWTTAILHCNVLYGGLRRQFAQVAHESNSVVYRIILCCYSIVFLVLVINHNTWADFHFLRNSKIYNSRYKRIIHTKKKKTAHTPWYCYFTNPILIIILADRIFHRIMFDLFLYMLMVNVLYTYINISLFFFFFFKRLGNTVKILYV